MKKSFILVLVTLLISVTTTLGQNVAALVAEYGLLKKNIDDGLDRTDKILEKNLAQAYMDMSAIVTQLDGGMKENLNAANRMLSSKEQNLYNQIRLTNMRLSGSADELNSTIGQSVDNLSNAAMHFSIFGNKSPWVNRLQMPIITTNQDEEVLIKLGGVNLDNDKNYLVLNGKEIKQPIIESPSSIIFKYSLTNSDTFKVGLNKLVVVLHKRRKAVTYEMLFKVYPNEIGNVIYTFVVEDDKRIYSDEFDHLFWKSASRSNQWKENNTTVNKRTPNTADKVWKIDMASVRIVEERQADGGGDCSWYINESNENRIKAKARAKGEGGLSGGAGQTHCRLYWKEYYDTKEEKTVTIKVPVNYYTQSVIKGPENIKHLSSVSFEMYNGKVFLYDESIIRKNEVPLTASFDRSRNQAFIKFERQK